MDELRPLSVRLRLSDPALADDLVRFFRKRESSAERVADDVVEVAILHTLGDRQGRMELGGPLLSLARLANAPTREWSPHQLRN